MGVLLPLLVAADSNVDRHEPLADLVQVRRCLLHSSDSLASPAAALTLGDLPVTEMAIISHHVGLHTLGRTPPGFMGRHPLVGLAPHGVLNHGISRLEGLFVFEGVVGGACWLV